MFLLTLEWMKCVLKVKRLRFHLIRRNKCKMPIVCLECFHQLSINYATMTVFSIYSLIQTNRFSCLLLFIVNVNSDNSTIYPLLSDSECHCFSRLCLLLFINCVLRIDFTSTIAKIKRFISFFCGFDKFQRCLSQVPRTQS